MLNVILLILKIIGIVLLILIFLCMLILFFPVTYNIEGHYDEKDYKFLAKAGWLFSFLSGNAAFDGDGLRYELKIAGIKLASGGEGEDDIEAGQGKEKTGEGRNYGTVDIDESVLDREEDDESEGRGGDDEGVQRSNPEDILDEFEKTDSIRGKNSAADWNDVIVDYDEDWQRKEPESEDTVHINTGKQKHKKDKSRKRKKDKKKRGSDGNSKKAGKDLYSEVEGFFRFLGYIYTRVRDFIFLVTDKTKSVYEKIERTVSIIKAKSTARAIMSAKNTVFKILYHLRPRNYEGTICAGLERPDIMGQLLGLLAIIYSSMKIDPEKLKVQSDFDRNHFNCDIMLKGHMITGVVLIYALRLYMNEDVQKLISDVRG